MSKLEISTPLEHFPRLSLKLGIDLWVKRDDLYPFTGGGNKSRKIAKFVHEARRTGADSLVTSGAVQSNHARVTALAAAANGWPCYLVLHGNEPSAPSANLLLCRMAGAIIRFVAPNLVKATLEAVEEGLRRQGRKPLVIPGGGHGPLGALAYLEAYHELRTQWGEPQGPDWIVVPSGTGTTQAGLVVGASEEKGRAPRMLGISVARDNPRAENIVQESCRELEKYLHINHLARPEVRDQWKGAGYGIPLSSSPRVIRFAAEAEGLILDPVYTGKAFTAVLDLVKSGEISAGATVVFWHTGGLLNLLSTSENGGALL